MRTRKRKLRLALAGLWIGLALSSHGEDAPSGGTGQVEPVAGSSLLLRLHFGFDGNAFGRVGLIGTAPPSIRGDPSSERRPGSTDSWLQDGFHLTGSDLYRINCRSCHGIGGQGLPPAIPAITAPVQASSPDLVAERMAARGRTVPATVAQRLAARAELGIRHRLLQGGLVMPPFDHLAAEEVDALLAFLEMMVGAPSSATKDPGIALDVARLGEHVIKANCQICHDATDRLAQRRPANDRDIPSLASMPQRYAIWEFVRKVREGSPDAAGTRGRMPRFPYLSREELAGAYVYLSAFPPIENLRENRPSP